jgi:hypothetical protein
MRFFQALTVTLVAVALLFGPSTASASNIDWTTWTGQFTGTINAPGLINVTYAGNPFGLAPGYPSWGPPGTFNGGTVGNAPPPSGGIQQLTGGDSTQNTITFSTPVVNPVFAIWSLGQGGLQAQFAFNQTPTFESGGPSNEYGGNPITVGGNTVFGVEGNGTVQFNGTFSSISWTNPVYEFWYGFTVGVPDQPIHQAPEPATILLLGAGLGSLALFTRRKKEA